MFTDTVQAAFRSEVSQVESIVYLPEGKHSINASKGGKPATLTVDVNESVLAAFREGLKQRQESNVRPFAGFDHKAGAASFIPQEFRYEDGVGLVLDVEWTQAGRTAIEGKDYSYFSPTFLVDDNGTPIGLPNRGEIGSLVNDPAFEEIPRIAASHQAPQPNNMIEHLIELGLVEAGHDEATALDAAKTKIEALRTEAEKAQTVEASANEAAEKIAALESEIEELKAEQAAGVEAEANAAVEEAVTAGRIAPQDDAAKAFWVASIKADKAAIGILKSIPSKVELESKVLAGRVEEENKTKEEPKGIDRVQAAFAAQKD
jgi:hypothetical protein